MTLERLLALWRTRMDDKTTVKLWSDEDGTEYFDDAVSEACIRGRLLRATTTQALTIGQAAYTMPAGWFELTAAKHSGCRHPLRICSIAVADIENPNWHSDTGDLARVIVTDLATNSYTVSPIPSAAGTLTLHGYRVPVTAELLATVGEQGVPVGVPENLQKHLVHWACFLAYQTRDSDAGDIQRAQFHERQFETYFGAPVTAHSLRIRQQARGQRVRGRFI